jgi:hypothetical protein
MPIYFLSQFRQLFNLNLIFIFYELSRITVGCKLKTFSIDSFIFSVNILAEHLRPRKTTLYSLWRIHRGNMGENWSYRESFNAKAILAQQLPFWSQIETNS